MKNTINKRILCISIISLIFILSPIVQADVTEPEYSDKYKIWLNLSEEEKKKYIEPIKYDIEYSTNKNNMARMLKSSSKSYFDLRDVISGMKVKNQMSTSQCWAFSTLSSLETNLSLLNDKKYIYDFSERHLEYATSLTFKNNVKNSIGYNREVGSGGTTLMALSYLTNGTGAIQETDMPFENNENKIEISEIQNKKTCTKVNDWVIFPNFKSDDTESKRTEKINNIKSHIEKYGSVFACINTGQSFYSYYNMATGAYYVPNAQLGDHAVSVIGWDDNYAVENFNSSNRPAKPGAFIVRNSWGEQFTTDNPNNAGYLFVSYEDPVIGSVLTGIVDSENKVWYDELYQHDKLGINSIMTLSTPKVYAANIFDKQSAKQEFITSVSIAIMSEQTCNIYINEKNGNLNKNDLKLVYSGTEELKPGYHTIKLENPIKIIGEKFAVAVEYTCGNGTAKVGVENVNTSTYSTEKLESNRSYISNALNGNWIDLKDSGAIANIKVFTNNTDGDIDKNGNITINDLSLQRNFILNKIKLSNEQKIKADLDGNGQITLNDLAKLRRKILGQDID